MTIAWTWIAALVLVCGCTKSAEQPGPGSDKPVETSTSQAARPSTPKPVAPAAPEPTAPEPTAPEPEGDLEPQDKPDRRVEFEAMVKPFLSEDDDLDAVEQGPFGPGDDTLIAIGFDLGTNLFTGYALKPDASAKHGARRLRMPRFAFKSMEGGAEFYVVENLDKDPALEPVIEFQAWHSGKSEDGWINTRIFKYVVLDWNPRRKRFRRLTALEKKLSRESKEENDDHLTKHQVRATLGLPASKP